MLVFFLAACFPNFPIVDDFPEDLTHDYDGDGQTELEGDCDDMEALAYLGAEEVCGDLIDNDCNDEVDEYTAIDATLWYGDADGDGFGLEAYSLVACLQPDGYVPMKGDCDDTVAAIHPDAQEICTPEDDDCDGLINEADEMADTLPKYYLDSDRDSWGRDDVVLEQCERPEGYVLDNGDCNDNDPLFNPVAVEFCDEADNDCDGLIDDADDNLQPNLVWTIDVDGDGYGTDEENAETRQQCSQPTGFAINTGDCNDNNSSIHPLAVEVCDGIDQDCWGGIDNGVLNTYSLDLDGDGFGGSGILYACDPSEALALGGTDNANDCDDTNAEVSPDALEYCNDGIDNDCDSFTDEPDAVDALIWYADSDEDGFGDVTRPQTACIVPDGYVSDSTDCNDGLDGVNPNASEDCTTLDDDDCSGSNNDINALGCTDYYFDGDGDNFGNLISGCLCAPEAPYSASLNTDCDDNNININPGKLEDCNTPEDDDCDESSNDEGASFCTYFYYDEDGDNFGISSNSICVCEASQYHRAEYPNDCNDSAPEINPDAIEVCDLLNTDENCNGLSEDSEAIGAILWYADVDGDGYGDPTPGLPLNDGRVSPLEQCDPPQGFVDNGDDCSDLQIAINPSMTETCSTAYDDNCDNNTNDDGATGCLEWYADEDLDGYGSINDMRCICDNEGFYTAVSGNDCNDQLNGVNPGSQEQCATTTIDDNCDGQLNEENAEDCTQYFYDADGDGWGIYDLICSCGPELGYEAIQMGDCNDDPNNNGAAQSPDLGNCGLSGAFNENDSVALLADGYYRVDQNFDYNNDGYSDVMIAKPDSNNEYIEAGEVHIIYGPLNGELGNPNDADLFFSPTLTYEEHAGLYGSVGDFDGDGAQEWVVGSSNRMYFFPDSMGTTQPFEEEMAEEIILLSIADLIDDSQLYGSSETPSISITKTLGDLNGDGADEFATGMVYLSSEVDNEADTYFIDGTSHSTIFWGNSDYSTVDIQNSTQSALRPCDLDGDGQPELLGEYLTDAGGNQNGIPWFNPSAYKLKIFDPFDLENDPQSLPLSELVLYDNAIPAFFDMAQEDSGGYGNYGFMTMGCVGDLNGDGASEIAISKRYQLVISEPDPLSGIITESKNYGHIRVLEGGSIPDSTLAITDFDTQFIGHEEGFYLGTHLTDPVDLNADNYDDLVVGSGHMGFEGYWGCFYQNPPSSTPRTMLYYGGFQMGSTYSSLDADGFIDDYIGSIFSAGDTNGDGADDLWIGDLLFLGTPF